LTIRFLKIFFKFISPLVGPLFILGHNLNTICRGPLDHVTHQISRLYALWFLTRFLNKRAQRALGRSPEEKVTVEPIIENPRGII